MAALCAGENTDKSGSRYVKPSLEGRFLEKFSDRAEKVLIRRVSSSNFAWYVTRVQSARFLGLARDFGLALIRKITWPAP